VPLNAGVAELADALDLGSITESIRLVNSCRGTIILPLSRAN
jgi:hypothetical protein